MLLRPDGSPYLTPGQRLLAGRAEARGPDAPRWMNLGLWSPGTQRYPDACAALADLVADDAALAPGMRVLDVGCGHGDGSLRWARTRGVACVGVTPVASQVRVATWRARALGEARVAFARADATALPARAGSLDRVLALESAFHFADRGAFLAAARKALRPGGRLVVADLTRRPGGARPTRWQQAVRRHCGTPEANVVTLQEYAASLERAGFSVLRARSLRERVFPGAARLLEAVESGAPLDEVPVRVRASDVAACRGASAWGRDMGLDDFGILVAQPREAARAR